MTHETQAGLEPDGGPEHDESLPAAESIPGGLTAAASDAAPLGDA